jgi:hypothetical protein
VAASDRHYLRRLDDANFLRTARACDQFVVDSPVPAFVLSILLLPSASGLYLLIATSAWGIALLLTIGRSVSLERRRRSTMHR